MSHIVASYHGKNLMKLFRYALVVTGLVTAFAFPAHAANHSMDATMMTCAAFIAMDAEGQVKSIQAMRKALEEMALDKMAPDATAPGATASDEMTSDRISDEMTAIVLACKGNPDMMALDAMLPK